MSSERYSQSGDQDSGIRGVSKEVLW